MARKFKHTNFSKKSSVLLRDLLKGLNHEEDILFRDILAAMGDRGFGLAIIFLQFQAFYRFPLFRVYRLFSASRFLFLLLKCFLEDNRFGFPKFFRIKESLGLKSLK